MKANATIASLFVAASVVVCGADELVLAEREKTFQEEIAEIAAATVPTTACDRAEVPASRLRLSVPGVRGEHAKDHGTLDGTAINAVWVDCVEISRMDGQ